MNQQAVAASIAVMYVGTKPFKEDNVAGTGVTWIGQGDIQRVPAIAWAKLSRHPDVWALPEEVDAKTLTPPEKEYKLRTANGQILDLGSLDDNRLRTFVKSQKFKLDDATLKAGGDILRQAIVDYVAEMQAQAEAEERSRKEADARAAAEAQAAEEEAARKRIAEAEGAKKGAAQTEKA